MISDRKIESLKKTISRQKETIDSLKFEVEDLKTQLENEKNINSTSVMELKKALEEVEQSKEQIRAEYMKVYDLQDKYKQIILEISELKSAYKKELKDVIKKAKKDYK